MNEFKPPIRSETLVERIVIATVRKFGRVVTATELWSEIDRSFDVNFEVRRRIIDEMLLVGTLIRDEVRDPKFPACYQRFYRLGPFIPEGATDE
jgi:hypothetical protein